MNKPARIILIILICSLLAVMSGFTLSTANNELNQMISQANTEGFSTISKNTDSVLQNNLYCKEQLIDSFGLSQRLLNKRISADGQFYRDTDDIMHIIDNSSSTGMIDGIIDITNYFNTSSTPVIIAQTYQRFNKESGFSSLFDGNAGKYIDELNKKLTTSGVEYYPFDYKSVFDSYNMNDKDIFFSTDVHYQTEAEFIIAKELLNSLNTITESGISNLDIISDKNQYDIEEYPFLGNLALNFGSLYVGRDNFEYFLPKFNTDLSIYNPDDSLNKSGSFEQVCLNGYRSTDYYRTYRITDYLRYPQPYYTIVNNLVDNNDILIIGDSLQLRTNAYLSLGCHSVTVLDIRFFYGANYIQKALSKNYDAVIIFPSSVLSYYSIPMPLSDYCAEIISCQIQSDGIHATVLNNSNSSWKNKDYVKCGLFKNGADTGVRAEIVSADEVKPGEEYTFIIPFTDFSEGIENFQVQMLQEGVAYFGPKVSVQYDSSTAVNDAEIVSNTAPAIVNHNEPYSMDITVRNTGTTTWNTATNYKLCIWQDGQDWGYRLILPDGVSVNPGEEYTFTLEGFVLPEAPQTTLEFQMLIEGVCYFGEREPAVITSSD